MTRIEQYYEQIPSNNSTVLDRSLSTGAHRHTRTIHRLWSAPPHADDPSFVKRTATRTIHREAHWHTRTFHREAHWHIRTIHREAHWHTRTVGRFKDPLASAASCRTRGSNQPEKAHDAGARVDNDVTWMCYQICYSYPLEVSDIGICYRIISGILPTCGTTPYSSWEKANPSESRSELNSWQCFWLFRIFTS